jgi:hypothetical protein
MFNPPPDNQELPVLQRMHYNKLLLYCILIYSAHFASINILGLDHMPLVFKLALLVFTVSYNSSILLLNVILLPSLLSHFFVRLWAKWLHVLPKWSTFKDIFLLLKKKGSRMQRVTQNLVGDGWCYHTNARGEKGSGVFHKKNTPEYTNIWLNWVIRCVKSSSVLN